MSQNGSGDESSRVAWEVFHIGHADDPNLTAMDARAYVVAALFGFVCGLMVPHRGDDRQVVLAALALITILGIGAWVWSNDPFAGPSMTVGGASCLLGASISRFRPQRQEATP